MKLEVVYENATKTDKRVFYTSTADSGERSVIVKAGDMFHYMPSMNFKIVKTETIE